MAFTTVTGSNGVTSLVGTTGVDVATIVTLGKDVFVGGNTGNDVVASNIATGDFLLENYNVRLGGGDDSWTTGGDVILNSFFSLDGETLANDGNDTFTGAGNAIINSEIVGRGGNDVFTGLTLTGSQVNGNTGFDSITLQGASSNSTVYGGKGSDNILTTAGANNASTQMMINGNIGADTITLAASGFTGEIYGGQDGDVINASAVTQSDATVLLATDTGLTLSGDKGNDNITGTNGVDALFGGEGADTIDGGTGADVVTGGAGFDLFVFDGTQEGLLIAGTNTGFVTINDLSASTAAIANGDTMDTGVAGAAIGDFEEHGLYASTGVDLATDLAAAITAIDQVGDIGTVTINGAVAWAGNYIVVGNDTDAGYDAADSVLKVNSLAGVTEANEANFFV